jgi:hypothetical protein
MATSKIWYSKGLKNEVIIQPPKFLTDLANQSEIVFRTNGETIGLCDPGDWISILWKEPKTGTSWAMNILSRKISRLNILTDGITFEDCEHEKSKQRTEQESMFGDNVPGPNTIAKSDSESYSKTPTKAMTSCEGAGATSKIPSDVYVKVQTLAILGIQLNVYIHKKLGFFLCKTEECCWASSLMDLATHAKKVHGKSFDIGRVKTELDDSLVAFIENKYELRELCNTLMSNKNLKPIPELPIEQAFLCGACKSTYYPRTPHLCDGSRTLISIQTMCYGAGNGRKKHFQVHPAGSSTLLLIMF